MEKTVFILGAGASVSANLPTQAKILPLIFTTNRNSFSSLSSNEDFLNLNINDKEQRLLDFYDAFDIYRQKLGEFIVTNFSSSEKTQKYLSMIDQANNIIPSSPSDTTKKEDLLKTAYQIAENVNVTLEDLFTIFDNVGAGREHFRLYSPQKMIEIHSQLKLCVIYVLSVYINQNNNSTDYDNFSKVLLKKRLYAKQKEDCLSVITMNWDNLLEQTLYNHCLEYNKTLSKRQTKVMPDLCFYNYDLYENNQHIPSTHLKAKGYKNIKILKMHGSLAWLECPKCGRIFTDFTNEIASEEFAKRNCPKCKKDISDAGDIPELRNLIITPTFLKSLDNLNIKNIWRNAYIDISEADHLVFIGYSFPDADFEMRCLLKKSVKNTADIKVVLCESDNPIILLDDLTQKGYTYKEAENIVDKMNLPSKRYISFFGEDKVDFFYGGFSSYIKELF